MRVTERPSSSYSSAMTPASMEHKNERVATTKASTDPLSAFILGVMAGAFIAFGATFMLVVQSDATLPFAVSRLLGALAFCVGLFLVLGAGAELFTGNCLMVMGPLAGRFSWGRLASSWAVVLVGNAVGAIAAACLISLADVGSLGGGALAEAAVSLAEGKATLAWGTAFARGVLCNVLVCLAVWISHAANSVTDKFFSALLPVMAFVACGFEHCVANLFFLPYALILQATGAAAGSVVLSGVLSNLSAATLGNLVGGVCLVGISYWFVYGRTRAEGDKA